MIDLNFVPETLEQCQQHYVPPIDKYISCEDFGNPDGMNGSCHWCLHMCPYQWEMCNDEAWIRGLLSPGARIPAKTREDAIEFIEGYKQCKYGRYDAHSDPPGELGPRGEDGVVMYEEVFDEEKTY